MNTEKIRQLNDTLRKTFIGGQVMLTTGIRAKSEEEQAEILQKVRLFNEFTKANDQLISSRAQETDLLEKIVDWKKKDRENTQKIEETQMNFHTLFLSFQNIKKINNSFLIYLIKN